MFPLLEGASGCRCTVETRERRVWGARMRGFPRSGDPQVSMMGAEGWGHPEGVETGDMDPGKKRSRGP